MKTFLVLCAVFCLSLAALTDEQRSKLLSYHDECSKETGVDENLVGRAMGGEFVNDDTFKKHLLCVSKKIGFQNDAGDLQVEVLKTKMAMVIEDPAKIDEIVSKCAVQKGTPEDTAFETIQCYYHAKHGK